MPATSSYLTRTTCRVCGNSDLIPLFSLGTQYVSDFVDKDKVHNGHKVPIDIDMCPRCTLVQQRHTAPPDILYSRKYWYKSGTTQTMREALRNVTQCAEHFVDLKPSDVVIDIGSNDGTLLRSYLKPCIKVGVEPAENLREEGSRGVDVFIGDFWSYEHVSSMAFQSAVGGLSPTEIPVKMKKAKVITACGMLYDLEDPNQFVADIARALAPDGLFITQLMCLKQTVERLDVGNFAHEHLEFYSLKSLVYLLRNHGLKIFDIEENDVNGGSYRLYIRHMTWCSNATATRETEGLNRVDHTLHVDEHGYDDPGLYKLMHRRMEANKQRVYDLLLEAKVRGKKVWVYGASTKGNVILQWAGIDKDLIDAAADRSPSKWGKYTVGTGIPIVSEEEFRKANPTYALVLPYAFLNEFINREAEWIRGGGSFIIPIPELRKLRQ